MGRAGAGRGSAAPAAREAGSLAGQGVAALGMGADRWGSEPELVSEAAIEQT